MVKKRGNQNHKNYALERFSKKTIGRIPRHPDSGFWSVQYSFD
jgi:hypothetical protein